ncbi:chemotaxis protein CheW [Stieleria varia]|uniref:CheW-like domain protein n=1 Tax=Stieleria varia TaxID=2528005 RepID=A0A5C5ZLV9_9BACT|nr:chemotaxis protein CheW [Stieleria varia]TWT88066.1 CheW-like domain protein [Stieleria varia]
MTTLTNNTSSIASLSDKHCIFRCGDAVFSLPATTVREVTHAPDIVPVPVSHDALAGIGHVHSEFLPVIALAPIVGEHAAVNGTSNQLLILNSPLGDWGILIDKVMAIHPVETHVAAQHRNDSTATVLLGTASFDGSVLSVLDVNSLQRVIQQTLHGRWTQTHPSTSH